MSLVADVDDENMFVANAGGSRKIGPKPTQQDMFLHETIKSSSDKTVVLAAVLDGHGPADLGHVVAESCSKRLVSEMEKENAWDLFEKDKDAEFKTCINQVIEKLESHAVFLNETHKTYAGTTLCVALVSKLIVGTINVGDSRAVLASEKYFGSVEPIQLTDDHKPSREDETKRVIDNGGWVTQGSVNNYITMTRSIGDIDLKQHRNITNFPGKKEGQTFGSELLISNPEVMIIPREEKHNFLIVATDGIWKVLSNKEAVKIVESSLRQDGKAENAAERLINIALEQRSQDNCAAVIVVLSQDYPYRRREKVFSKLKR